MLVKLPPNHQSQEDIIDHVWTAIYRVYFAPRASTTNGDRCTVLREPYRGPPNHTQQHKPNILVVRLHPQPVLGGMRVYGRDYLWVECKPSDHDTPSGWKNLVHEATVRLDSARPRRNVTVIVAVRLKMMAFWWDAEACDYCTQNEHTRCLWGNGLGPGPTPQDLEMGSMGQPRNRQNHHRKCPGDRLCHYADREWPAASGAEARPCD